LSLKEFTKEIFTRYGLTEDDINIYLVYLRVPRATISEAYITLSEDHPDLTLEKVEEITKKLDEKGFVKIIPGLVERVIPLEPYFELFTKESEGFRNEIAKIKDAVLADQSSRFEKLEQIQDKALNEIDTAVSEQIKAFFDDSDAKNKDKQERIEKAKNRFTETSKTLEKELHENIEKDFSELKKDIEELIKELDTITGDQETDSKTQESNIHNIFNALNSDLKSISQSFVSDNESAIDKAKDDLTRLISDLLDDFTKRLDNLEKEMKQQLDDHVERHKSIANELKPKMEQILEKYLERMDKVITDLKERISKLLGEHIEFINKTTKELESKLGEKLDNRHKILIEKVNEYRNKARSMLSTYLEEANRFSDFAEDLTKIGLFFTKKKKSKFRGRWTRIEEGVASISRTYDENFLSDWNEYIDDTKNTTNELKNDIATVIANENQVIKTETENLDKRAQDTISAELESLAADLSGEIDNTLQSGIKDCSDTTIKLKDSLSNSKNQHHKQYNDAINRHKEDSLRHYTSFDSDIKGKNERWVKDVDMKFENGKREITSEIDKQITNIKNYNSKQKKVIDDRVNKIRSDFDNSKKITSDKIDAEIKLWDEESADLNKMISDMLEDHKNKYKENATTLQNSLSNTTRDTIQNVKDAIADFTLQFMTSIDDATELAETNEEKLTDIHKASSQIPEIAEVTTWHTVGREALINAIKDAILRTKSSIIIVTPVVIPEILQFISEFAFQKKTARFMLTSHFDMQTYGNIIQKMQQLGNIQFRQLSTAGEFYAVTRDAEEVIICPAADKESEMISIVSNQPMYSKLYSSFIGPIFQANSRPIK